jgi:hypothetical protein
MMDQAQDLTLHLDEGELEAYSMADLRGEGAAGFEEHLLKCERCQQRLAETDVYVAAMRRAAAQLLQPEKAQRAKSR